MLVLKNAVKFLLSGLLTLAILAGPLVYREIELLKESQRVDQVGNLINTAAETAAYQAESQDCDVDELTWLACGIYFESRGEPVAGQYTLAHSILNRVEDGSRWPNTIEAVLRQDEERRHRCQYSFMCDGEEEDIFEEISWMQALEIATMAMEEYYDSGPITCAHSFRAKYVTSESALKWFATLEETETIGNHIFYCDRQS